MAWGFGVKNEAQVKKKIEKREEANKKIYEQEYKRYKQVRRQEKLSKFRYQQSTENKLRSQFNRIRSAVNQNRYRNPHEHRTTAEVYGDDEGLTLFDSNRRNTSRTGNFFGI